LGCDSHIHLNAKKDLVVGPERVVPLAYLSTQFPAVLKRLNALVKRSWAQSTPDWLEYWYLLRELQDESLLTTNRLRALVDLLRDGPLPIPEILKKLDVLHISQLGAEELVRQEVIGKAGLTPTDLLHISGEYNPWSREAAEMARMAFCHSQYLEPEQFEEIIWKQINEMILRAILTFLSGKNIPAVRTAKDDIGPWFFENSLYDTHPQLETRIRLRRPIIGIGAPAEIFLRNVARVLNTELILPEHHPVANAVGAIAGSVMVMDEVLIYPHLSGMGLDVIGYFVQAGDGQQEFEELAQALAYSRELSHDRALNAALRSGADNPEVVIEEINDGLDTYRIRARAVGNPRLMR
jgi:N-methylhydantoinase A/oxoprolinase/acetone carboxylase beta subunit